MEGSYVTNVPDGTAPTAKSGSAARRDACSGNACRLISYPIKNKTWKDW